MELWNSLLTLLSPFKTFEVQPVSISMHLNLQIPNGWTQPIIFKHEYVDHYPVKSQLFYHPLIPHQTAYSSTHNSPLSTIHYLPSNIPTISLALPSDKRSMAVTLQNWAASCLLTRQLILPHYSIHHQPKTIRFFYNFTCSILSHIQNDCSPSHSNPLHSSLCKSLPTEPYSKHLIFDL